MATDVIGFRPLYYHRRGDLLVFASEIKAILAHPRVPSRPNDDLVSAFLMRDYNDIYPGETFFDGISSLTAGHLAILNPEGLRLRQYRDLDNPQRIRFKSYPDYVEAFGHLFQQAVRRRLRSAYPVAVAVSGGLDSSSIFCQAETLRSRNPERYPPLVGLSFIERDYTLSHEEVFLEEIERFYGVTVERLPAGPMGYLDNLEQEVWHGETPFLEWKTMHQMEEAARRRGARVFLYGFWGDELLMGESAYLVDLFRSLRWKEIKEHLQEVKKWYTTMEFPKVLIYQFFETMVRHHMPRVIIPWARRLRAALGLVLGNPWKLSWHAETSRQRALRRLSVQKSFRHKAFASVHAKSLYKITRGNIIKFEWWKKSTSWHGLDLAVPFMDRDLVAFLLAIPGDMVVHQGVAKGILRSAMRGVLPEAIRQRRTKSDYTLPAHEGLQIYYPRLKELVQSGGMAARFGFIKEKELTAELERQREKLQKGQPFAYWNLIQLLGVEIWLKEFFGNIQ